MERGWEVVFSPHIVLTRLPILDPLGIKPGPRRKDSVFMEMLSLQIPALLP